MRVEETAHYGRKVKNTGYIRTPNKIRRRMKIEEKTHYTIHKIGLR